MTSVLAANSVDKVLDAHSELQSIRDALCDSPELSAKEDIQPVADITRNKTEGVDRYSLPGDDCAAFPSGDGYQLLAIEGMLPDFVKQDPWHAGWSAVMANISDIAAMGGRATAVVNAYWHHDRAEAVQIMKGIRNACDVFGINLAGGHTSISMSHQAGLAVAVLGYATDLLSCHHVEEGQCIYMAVDLQGQWHGDNNYWNVLSGKNRQQIRAMWDLLPQLAESQLISAAKDISNGGLLGSLLMMLELKQLGATIDVKRIPRPGGTTEFIRWLKAFQSYGFLLTGPPECVLEVEEYFAVHNIKCTPVGRVTEQPVVMFDNDDASMEFWDLRQTAVTGMSFANRRL